MTLKILFPISTLLFTTLACDPAIEEADVEVAEPNQATDLEAEPDAERRSQLIQTVMLADDIHAKVFMLVDGSTGILLEGPVSASMAAEHRLVDQVLRTPTSPDEAALLLADLAEETSAERAATRTLELRHAPTASQTPGGPGAVLAAADAAPVAATACNGVNAFTKYPSDQAWNFGNCDWYLADIGEYTDRLSFDVIGFAGHAVALKGSVYWDIRTENWGVGDSSYALEHYQLNEGQHAYFTIARITNDYNVRSRVVAMTNGSKHHHDVAICHDWYARVVALASSTDTFCAIEIGTSNPTRWYEQGHGYVGPDPSNIPTGM